MKCHRSALLLALALGLLAACGAPPGRRAVVSELDAAQRAQAREAYEELLQAERGGDAQATYEAGLRLVDEFPGADAEAHALLITARAARRLDRPRAEEQLLRLLVRDHPDEDHAVEAWSELALLARDRGRWADEADALVRFDGAAADEDPRRARARERLLELLQDDLSVEEIDALLVAHPNSAAASTAAWIAARRVYEEDRQPDDAGARLEAFLEGYPRSRYAEDARALLAELSQRYGRDTAPGLAVARVDRIGLLAPLTGEYAALGQALFEGALIGVEEFNRATGSSLALVSRDTRGDEVEAVHGARELIEDEQVIAIVGGLLSSTTVAAATLCQERSVPLVSPTATKETIKDLGPQVFQTNLTKDRETWLLAHVAVRGMMRKRFAILHADTDEGRSIADRFTAELEREGGHVVARASYDRDVTDFAVPIAELRSAAPEALFVPATANDMRLIAPQLIFHDLRAELFGLSSWNNNLLLREAGASMEQAVMPSEVALVPEEGRQRFEELWRRRFPQSSSSPIGLKAYMAVIQIIQALDVEGGITRQRLRLRLEEALDSVEAQDGRQSTAPLRVVRGGELHALPIALFPGLAPVVELEPLEDRFELPGDGPDQPGP